MHGYFLRTARLRVEEHLLDFPAVAVLGPRQCGKTTLAKMLVENRPSAVYLDLEKPSDRRKLQDPELYIQTQRNRCENRLF